MLQNCGSLYETFHTEPNTLRFEANNQDSKNCFERGISETRKILGDVLIMDYNNALSNNVFNISTISTPIDDEHSLSTSQRGFWNILKFTIIIIGTVANITMLVFLVKEKKKKTSFTVYLFAILVNDIISLVNKFLYTSLLDLFYIDILNTSTFVCKYLPYITSSSTNLHGWFLLAVTTERLFHAQFPRMTKLFERRKSGLIAVVLIACASLFINIHYALHLKLIVYQRLSDGTVVEYCYVDGGEYPQYYRFQTTFIAPLISAVLPGLCILVEDFFRMKIICRSLREPAASRRISVHERDLNVLTFMISVGFLCIEVPVLVVHYYTFNTGGVSFIDALYALNDLNHSFKGLLYLLYNQTFRKRCIRCKASCETNNIN